MLVLLRAQLHLEALPLASICPPILRPTGDEFHLCFGLNATILRGLRIDQSPRHLGPAIRATIASHKHAHVLVQPIQETCERVSNDDLFVVGGNENGVNQVPQLRMLLVEGPYGPQPPYDRFDRSPLPAAA